MLWDIQDENKAAFFRFVLASDSKARQHYDSMVAKAKEVGALRRWKSLVKLFASRYASVTKQAQISSRLDAVTIEGVKTKMKTSKKPWINL